MSGGDMRVPGRLHQLLLGDVAIVIPRGLDLDLGIPECVGAAARAAAAIRAGESIKNRTAEAVLFFPVKNTVYFKYPAESKV